MKHIKLFESWEEDYKKDLAFPDDRDFSSEESAAYHRFISLINDRDFSSSLDKIKEMHSQGQIDEVLDFLGNQSERKEPVDRLFIRVLEKNREDVAEFLYRRGYRIQDLEEVTKWLQAPTDNIGKGRISDDIAYSARKYSK